MARKTDNEIMEAMQSTAASKGVTLTYTHKLFFLKLLAYASKYGETCPEGVKIFMSVQDLSEYLSISRRMVAQSLKLLTECDIIQRHKGKNSFPRSTNTTILKKEYYEK